MRKLLFIILLASHLSAQVSFIRAVTNAAPLATPSVLVSTGNTVVVGCGTGSTGSVTVTSVTDTALNTYVAATSLLSTPGAGQSIQMWVAYNATGNASDVVVCHLSGSGWINTSVFVLSGAASSSAVDRSAFGSTGGATSVTTTAFTPRTSGEIAIACGIWNSSATTVIAGSGYTVPSGGFDSTNGWGCEYQLSISTSSQTATLSNPTSHAANIMVATFSTTPIVNGVTMIPRHKTVIQ